MQAETLCPDAFAPDLAGYPVIEISEAASSLAYGRRSSRGTLIRIQAAGSLPGCRFSGIFSTKLKGKERSAATRMNSSGVNARPDVGSEAATSSSRHPGNTVKVTTLGVLSSMVTRISTGDMAGLSMYSPACSCVSSPGINQVVAGCVPRSGMSSCSCRFASTLAGALTTLDHKSCCSAGR